MSGVDEGKETSNGEDEASASSSGPEDADVEEESGGENADEQPILWSACSDRGSNVVKGVNSLFEDGAADDCEIAVPCDANHCVCHLCKGAIDALLDGRYNAATFASDCVVVLGVSAVLQRKGEGQALLQDVATAETSHLVPLRKGETRWEGLHQSMSRFVKMKEAYVGFWDDPDAGPQCLEKAGIKFETDFPEQTF